MKDENTISSSTLVEEYAEWIKRESSIIQIGKWQEITLPLLDSANDYITFYAKTDGANYEFTDDGFTLHSFHEKNISITKKRDERIKKIAARFGARIQDSEIVLSGHGNRPNALNRFSQTILGVLSIAEANQQRVSEYFSEDVAQLLDQNEIYYTRDITVKGMTGYEQTFDFLFQKSKNHYTRYCQAPNHLDKDSVRQILFSWQDIAQTRSESQLIVIGNDIGGKLNNDAINALKNYNALVIPYTQLPEKATECLAA